MTDAPSPRSIVVVVWDAEDEPVQSLCGLAQAVLEIGDDTARSAAIARALSDPEVQLLGDQR